MKVYVVLDRFDDENEVMGVFLSREKAVALVEDARAKGLIQSWWDCVEAEVTE